MSVTAFVPVVVCDCVLCDCAAEFRWGYLRVTACFYLCVWRWLMCDRDCDQVQVCADNVVVTVNVSSVSVHLCLCDQWRPSVCDPVALGVDCL